MIPEKEVFEVWIEDYSEAFDGHSQEAPVARFSTEGKAKRCIDALEAYHGMAVYPADENGNELPTDWEGVEKTLRFYFIKHKVSAIDTFKLGNEEYDWRKDA